VRELRMERDVLLLELSPSPTLWSRNAVAYAVPRIETVITLRVARESLCRGAR